MTYKYVSLNNEVKELEEGKFYMIRDAETKFTCTNYSFIKEGRGKGEIAKWFYRTHDGYPSGVYVKTAKTVLEQLKYLEYMNSYLGQDKKFEIFEVDADNLVMSKNCICEELNVTRYHKPDTTTSRMVIKDNNGLYVDDSAFLISDKAGEWIYWASKGRHNCFTRYKKIEAAQKVLNRLQTIATILNIDKKFEIVEVDIDSIPRSEDGLIEYYTQPENFKYLIVDETGVCVDKTNYKKANRVLDAYNRLCRKNEKQALGHKLTITCKHLLA